ncbi:MAG TPA: asparagine synthase (glutamine-hydrolyzing) [Candidatus Sulfotelmatobacter sp.]|nr:asparagine synthase (glutamine-hydrolyzing) [Candidatus Sulfotelmatobacter sp.]
MIRRDGESVTAEQVRQMTDTIVHRGPDDEGIYARANIGLGMRRLSIIDLSGGHQPIYNEDGTVIVVFNGEIYNFLQLRDELVSRGHQFRTHSDTEVIVHLYEELGADCIKKLRGMFAIALYDTKRNSLLLARDRLGKKPLYYATHRGTLYFGSEIKTMLAVAPELAEVDPEGVLRFFYFGYIPDPHSAFREIKKLPPGHLAEYKNGQIQVHEYWDVPAYGSYDPGSDQACLEEMERRLAEAVRIRLISDVPLGALLSGGVDSSIVVALMARESSAPVKTFSIGFRKADFNEADHARAVAERFQTDHHELVVDPDITEMLQHLTGMMEEPFGDSSMIPTFCVSQLARRHVTVALSGDGGDELFAGYDRYIVNWRRQRYDFFPSALGKMYRDHFYPLLPQTLKGRKFSWNITLSSRDRYLDGLSFLPALHRERSLFSSDFVVSARSWSDPFEQFQHYHDSAPASDQLSRLMYLDTKTYLTADILTKVDRMSMATSLEMRCPILDHEFVEWAASLPVKYKFRDGTRKFIFRKLAERLGIPSEVLNRRKQGFSLPLIHWMRHELKDELMSILLEPRTLQRGYFEADSIRTVLDDHFRRRRDHSGILWMLLIFELWHRNFLEREVSREPALAAARLRQSVRSASSGVAVKESARP